MNSTELGLRSALNLERLFKAQAEEREARSQFNYWSMKLEEAQRKVARARWKSETGRDWTEAPTSKDFAALKEGRS